MLCDSGPDQLFRARGGECDMCVSVVLFVFKPILENWVGCSRCEWWRSIFRPVLCEVLLISSECLKSGSPLDNKDLEYIYLQGCLPCILKGLVYLTYLKLDISSAEVIIKEKKLLGIQRRVWIYKPCWKTEEDRRLLRKIRKSNTWSHTTERPI